MSDFGVLLSVGSGQPFVTPVSTPMSMYGRYIINSTSNGSASSASLTIPWVGSRPIMVFLKSNVVGTALYSTKTANSIIISGSNRLNATFTITAYVFGIFPQIAPAWGLAIYDATGQLILTNETRVLSDLITVGNASVASQSGVGIDITLNGSYAVCPVIHGSMLFQNTNAGTGQPIIVNVTAYSSCANTGGTTRFTAALNQAPGGNPVGTTDSRCVLVAINTAVYD